MGSTSIEWTDDSHNPIRARLRDAAHAGLTKGGYGSGVGHYCEKVSSGCANCYSSTSQARFGMPTFPGRQKGEPPVEVFLDEARLVEPLSWRRPRRVFLCDMTDLFGEWVPFDWIDRIFAVMALTPHLTWQILTKRPERMAEYLNDRIDTQVKIGQAALPLANNAGVDWDVYGRKRDFGNPDEPPRWPLKNCWIGTSVENQAAADERIPHLLRCPAAVRFLSCEPLLSSVDLRGSLVNPDWNVGLPGIDWVIVGGESGAGARPFNVDWARDIVLQCKCDGVACFVKQFGTNPVDECEDCTPQYTGWPATDSPIDWDTGRVTLKDKKGGAMEEWPEALRIREFPAARS